MKKKATIIKVIIPLILVVFKYDICGLNENALNIFNEDKSKNDNIIEYKYYNYIFIYINDVEEYVNLRIEVEVYY